MAGCEGAVEASGGLGEFDWRQLEKPGGGTDELGGDVASAAGSLTDGHAKGGIAKWATCGSGQSAVCWVAADESVGRMVLRPLNGA